jgi:hypothetical protein
LESKCGSCVRCQGPEANQVGKLECMSYRQIRDRRSVTKCACPGQSNPFELEWPPWVERATQQVCEHERSVCNPSEEGSKRCVSKLEQKTHPVSYLSILKEEYGFMSISAEHSGSCTALKSAGEYGVYYFSIPSVQSFRHDMNSHTSS